MSNYDLLFQFFLVCFFLVHTQYCIVIYGFLDQRFENLAISIPIFADGVGKIITCTVLVSLLGRKEI